jgi:transcriptional regulator with XRE-family HTH domain
MKSSIFDLATDTDPVDTYGDRLRRAMTLAGYTQNVQLARAMGVTKQAVHSVLKSGAKGMLNAANSVRAAEACEVDHRWLALGEGEPRVPLMTERLALSTRAVYIGMRLDEIADHARREAAYAVIVQMLDFGAGGLPGAPGPAK